MRLGSREKTGLRGCSSSSPSGPMGRCAERVGTPRRPRGPTPRCHAGNAQASRAPHLTAHLTSRPPPLLFTSQEPSLHSALPSPPSPSPFPPSPPQHRHLVQLLLPQPRGRTGLPAGTRLQAAADSYHPAAVHQGGAGAREQPRGGAGGTAGGDCEAAS